MFGLIEKKHISREFFFSLKSLIHIHLDSIQFYQYG